MADNTKQSADDVIATDDIGGVKYQRMKLTIGEDGVDAGDVSDANPLPVSASTLPLPSGAATSAKQDSAIALQGTLESLVDTLHELVQRLAPLGGAISMVGGQALRVSYGGGTFAVSGPQTSAQFIAAYHVAGTNYPFAVALHNMAAQANINNVTAA